MANKIIDGLFVGDAESSQDMGFLVQNKILSVVNTSCKECKNSFGAYGEYTPLYFHLDLMQNIRRPCCPMTSIHIHSHPSIHPSIHTQSYIHIHT